jgi:hypothetical protein
MSDLGKFLIIAGLILLGLGAVLLLAPKIPWLGRLPGDLSYKGERFSFYFPLTTCIVVSVVLTIIFSLLRR